MLRMSESSAQPQFQLQLSVQSLPEQEAERGLQSAPQFQPPHSIQDPGQAPQQVRVQHQLQLNLVSTLQPPQPQNQPDPPDETKPVWVKHCRLLLLLLCGISICAVILSLVYYTHQHLKTESTACQWASARISLSADPFARPCDYFMFTCRADTPAPGERQRAKSSLGDQQRREKDEEREISGLRREKLLSRKTVLLEFLRGILESSEWTTSSAVQKTRSFYHSCLDTRSIDSVGTEPFLTLIQKLGGWAVSGQWNQTDFNSTLSLLMRDYSTFPFFNIYVGKDPNEIAHSIARNYIHIDQPDLLLPTEWNSETKISQAIKQTVRPFFALCQKYMVLLGAQSSNSIDHASMFTSLSSELAVAAAPLEHRSVNRLLFQGMTIKELQKQAPAIDWLGCLQAVFHPLHISQENHILLHNIHYVVQMSHVIGKWLNKDELSSRGPLHTFMIFNLLHTLMPALDSRFSEIAKNLSLVVGTAGAAPRWKLCMSETERGFDSVLIHLLSEKTARQEAEEMIENIFSSFESKLLDLEWTDDTFLQFIMTKIQHLIPRLWTATEIPSKPQLDQIFAKVTVDKDRFFSNYIQLLSLWQKRRTKMLAEADGVDVLSVTPVLVDNELIFPMGMFIPPLFNPNYPRAMNYGVLGFLIAKDILHLLLPDIRTQSRTVHTVGECVWSHYLSVTGDRHTASLLSAAQQQELWVQYSALQIALEAYQKSLKNRPGDMSLLGLSHTRLFLTSFAQLSCDADPYWEFMPLEPSFLTTVICAKPNLCPTRIKCTTKPHHRSLPTC
ncbi:kell blood group glycoprotein isoform X2 [Thalassophryne amazonica]|uniref:kell blood group glycoprotein isoform X2 n=1 Tax=Thalassophryne amazonica TaxID=390379 RepID=UPI0014724D9B|nr:kell blood group glycoprotein isoform X2 [Thalassophryne amazonica]